MKYLQPAAFSLGQKMLQICMATLSLLVRAWLEGEMCEVLVLRWCLPTDYLPVHQEVITFGHHRGSTAVICPSVYCNEPVAVVFAPHTY